VCERFDGSVYDKKTGKEISKATRTEEEAQQHAIDHETNEEKEKKDQTKDCKSKSTFSTEKVCVRESGEEYDPKTGKVTKPAPGTEVSQTPESGQASDTAQKTRNLTQGSGDDTCEFENPESRTMTCTRKDGTQYTKGASEGGGGSDGIVANRSSEDYCEYPEPESRTKVCTTADGTQYDEETGEIVDDDGFDDDNDDAIDTSEESEEDEIVDDDDGEIPDDDGQLQPDRSLDGDFDEDNTPDGDSSGFQGEGLGGDDDGFGGGSDDEGGGDGDSSGETQSDDDTLGDQDEPRKGPWGGGPGDFAEVISADESISDIYSNAKRTKWSRDTDAIDSRDRFLDEKNLSTQVSSGVLDEVTVQNSNPVTSLPRGYVQESRVRTGVNPFKSGRFMKLNAMSRYEP